MWPLVGVMGNVYQAEHNCWVCSLMLNDYFGSLEVKE